MATAEKRTWTVLELLNWTREFFRGRGIDNSRLNAEVLLAHVLGCERIMLYARFDEVVGEKARDEFRKLVRRRGDGEPLQYLLGEWEFFGRAFELTSDVLIPRQETELVVEACLEVLPEGVAARVADVGTGSGALAVTLAAERAGLQVIATDVSEAALAVARRNAERHAVADRIRFARGELTQPVRSQMSTACAGLQLLVSNLPYIPTGRIPSMPREVREHEPYIALDGGPDGLSIIRRLVPRAPESLVPGGWLVLELGEGQAGTVRQMVQEAGQYDMDTVKTVTGPDGCERVFRARTRPE